LAEPEDAGQHLDEYGPFEPTQYTYARYLPGHSWWYLLKHLALQLIEPAYSRISRTASRLVHFSRRSAIAPGGFVSLKAPEASQSAPSALQIIMITRFSPLWIDPEGQ